MERSSQFIKWQNSEQWKIVFSAVRDENILF